MQRQGRRGFLKIFFPLTFSSSHLHKNPAKTHTHTTIPCQERGTMPCKQPATLPCRGKVTLFPSCAMHDGTRQWGLSLRLPIKTRGVETNDSLEGGIEETEREQNTGGRISSVEKRETETEGNEKKKRKICLRDRGEKAKTEVGKRRTETGGLSTEKKKDHSSPPGHHRCVSFPPPQQHRHPATISVANASRTRVGEEKQDRTEREENNRDRGLCTEEEKKRQPRHRLESSSFLLPDAAPTTFHHRQTENSEEQNKHRRGAEKAEGSRKKKKQPLAATTVCRCCHHRHLSTASSSTQSLLLQVTPSPHLCFFVSLLACRTCTVHVSASKQNN